MGRAIKKIKLDQLTKMRTWILVDNLKPEDTIPISNRWVFQILNKNSDIKLIKVIDSNIASHWQANGLRRIVLVSSVN
jgi:hypothetical protein